MPNTKREESHPTGELHEGLRRLGYDRFRAGQREAIETLLAIGRLLFVAPTGGGKSLVYQLPAALLPGTAIVISPLISLMQDQVAALEARGVPATYLASTLDPDELGSRLAAARRGAYKLVYTAPERLLLQSFRTLLSSIDCWLVAIDEAHCINEWGHDFRPEYLQIGDFLRLLPEARVVACTATATPVVRDEIVARLGLPHDTPQIVHGFARPNLALRVCELAHKKDRRRQVDTALTEALGDPATPAGAAIVYAPTRKATQVEADRLRRRGWNAAAYHAGLSATVRDRVQTAFATGRLPIVVATNAFGMGIDRGDVRCVLHLAPPGSIEAYYQEVGRAGRDGRPATALLLVSPGDMSLRRRLIQLSAADASSEIAEHKWNLFLELMRWAEGGSCRHDAILRYFGDQDEALAGCGRCDVCRSLGGSGVQDPAEVTLCVRKALSAVARIDGRFGITVAAKLLRGASDPRLDWSGLSSTPTFGALREYPELWVLRLLRRCITAGWVQLRGGNRPLVALTPAGRAVMKAEQPARLLLPPFPSPRRPPIAGDGSDTALDLSPETPPRSPSAPSVSPTTAKAPGGQPQATSLFQALREHRRDIARSRKVPPYVVASDHTLREIAATTPRTVDQLLLVYGMGPTRAARYGPGLLAVVARHLGEES